MTENVASYVVCPDVGWLRDVDVHYWGDIDTHGFGILNRHRRAAQKLK